MTINSLTFIAFVAIVVCIYYLVPKKMQWIVLLTASYGFYLCSGVKHIIYIIATTIISYLSGRWMQKLRDNGQKEIEGLGEEATREEKKAIKAKQAKKIHRIQVCTVLINLGVLAYVKYLNFFLGNIENLFSFFKWDISMPMVNVIVPLGLSYYTFNSIGYLIDIGRGRIKAEKNIGRFALFISFFPIIVQGPLYRYEDVGKQLKDTHKYEYLNIKYGAQLILWGFFKKIVIADKFAVIANTVFAPGYANYSGSHIFFGVLAYSFQIYGDFSGGIDITRGVAQMLGINLPVNFARPFFATSMADFWRRWHMSLGAWMREYVFYPVMLSGKVTNLSKKVRKRFGTYAGKMVPSVVTPMVVFFLMNIWHGISWQRIVNGVYNALIISSTVALTPAYKKLAAKLRINTEVFSFRLFQMIRTFLLLSISRIIVKAPSLGEAFRMIKKMFTDVDVAFITGINKEIYGFGVSEKEMDILIIAIVILLVVGILQEMGIKIRESLEKQNIVFRWGLMIALLVFVLIFGQYGPGYSASSFIYGRY